MRFVIVAAVLFSVAFAIEPEILPEFDNNEIDEQLNELMQEATELENEMVHELGETDNEIINELAEEIKNEIFTAKWDIDAPDYSVKKKAMPKRGKVLQAINLTKMMKKTIVAAHNRARSITKPTASNMRKMTWDNSLEKLATQYTRKCIYEHNPNAKNQRFSYVGENLFISMGLPYNKQLLDYAVKAWDGEKTVYNYDTTTCQVGKVCGHYTQVVWADSFKVGCGVTRCGNIDVRGKIWKNAILFGCNYGPGGNYRGEKPYLSGTKCTKCDNSDKCKGKLCSNSIRDRPVFNPKMAKWSPWSKWSACSVTCGMGQKRRERSCNTFVPTDCKGYASEVGFCSAKPCKRQSTKFEFIIKEGDNFSQSSLENFLLNNPQLFRRRSG